MDEDEVDYVEEEEEVGDEDDYDYEDQEEEEDEDRIDSPVASKGDLEEEDQEDTLDSLLLHRLQHGDVEDDRRGGEGGGEKKKTRTMTKQTATGLFGEPRQNELALEAVKAFAAAREPAATKEDAFARYMEGLESFRKLALQSDLYLQLDASLRFVVYEGFRLSKRMGGGEGGTDAATQLLAKMRNFVKDFKSQAAQTVGMALCLRIGSAAMSQLKLFCDRPLRNNQSNLVTVDYYRGRWAAIEGRTEDAIRAFRKTYYGIPDSVAERGKHAFANKKRAFEKLLPLMLITGKYPKRKLLERYNLAWRYDSLIAAVKSGDLRRLGAELDKQNDYFLRMNCLTLLSVSLTAIIRQHVLRIVSKELQSNVLPLSVVGSLSCWHVDPKFVRTEEDRENYMMFVASDLISRGLVKGKITLDGTKGPCLVLDSSAFKPFPTLHASSPASFKLSKW